jgi:hypothetical protein
MPLVRTGGPQEAELGEAAQRARKIDPRYADGDLVRVAGGRNQAEAELIQNLLLEEGVPSILRRTAGFDVPDFLAAGPRDVLVPRSGAEAAHEVLLQVDLAPQTAPARQLGRQELIVAGALLGGTAAAALVAWLVVNA